MAAEMSVRSPETFIGIMQSPAERAEASDELVELLKLEQGHASYLAFTLLPAVQGLQGPTQLRVFKLKALRQYLLGTHIL